LEAKEQYGTENLGSDLVSNVVQKFFKKVNLISLSSGILVRPMFHSNRQTNPEVKVGYD
jgi:hypothetical protein